MKAKGAQNKNKSISVPQYKICVQISKRWLSVSPGPPCRRPTVEREGWKAEGGWEAAPGPGAGGTSPLPRLQSDPSWEGGAGVLKMQNAKMQTAKPGRRLLLVVVVLLLWQGLNSIHPGRVEQPYLHTSICQTPLTHGSTSL